MESTNQDFISQVKEKIKQNKKYKTISDDIVLEEINLYLRKHPQITSIDKTIIKDIRKNLHRIYSSYQTKKKRRWKRYLEELKLAIRNHLPLTEINKRLLSLTVSAKERLDYYPEIYSKIFEITGPPVSVTDLGCGLNPLSFPFMNLSSLTYSAYDIDEEDIEFLNNYFKLMKFQGISGTAKLLDIRNLPKIKKLPRSDVVFLFKLLDLINTNSDKPGERLILALLKNSRFLVVSFATRTLTGRPMNLPRRKGFELMLDRNNLSFKMFKIPNEIFYVISSFQ